MAENKKHHRPFCVANQCRLLSTALIAAYAFDTKKHKQKDIECLVPGAYTFDLPHLGHHTYVGVP